MDRYERKPILEPLLLILKQRTGVATIIGIILAIVLKYFDFDNETVVMVVSLTLAYVGGQKLVDAKEASAPIIDFSDRISELLEEEKQNENSKSDSGKL